MSNKYHNRDHYEIVLLELMKFAARPAIDVTQLSNLELLMQINNLLAFYDLETYTLNEIECIAAAMNKVEVKAKPTNQTEELFDDSADPFFSNTKKIPVDKDGKYLTREKRQQKNLGL